MNAFEAKYNASYLVVTYATVDVLMSVYSPCPSCSVDVIYGMVFALLIAYVNDVQSVSNI